MTEFKVGDRVRYRAAGLPLVYEDKEGVRGRVVDLLPTPAKYSIYVDFPGEPVAWPCHPNELEKLED